jgi:signal transduction histidine kinase/ActR/RegA family two-component response regulator/HAMP domain-containing protein
MVFINIRNKISRHWKEMSIPSKFDLGGRLFLVLLVMVAATGYVSLKKVRNAEKSIFISSEIQRLVLDMDRGMERSYRLYYRFLLQYPVIGFQEAHQQYLQPSIRQIARVITASKVLKLNIEESPVSIALQKSDIDLNLYLSSARRYAETAIDSVELITRLSAPDRGLEAQLLGSLDLLQKELTGHENLLNLYHEMRSHTQEYRILRKRFLMQSAFNVSFRLHQQIRDMNLDSQKKKRITVLLDDSIDISEKILKIDLNIKSIINDFSLQQKAVNPISISLVALAKEEVKQAKLRIASTHRLAVFFMAAISLLGLFAALGIRKLLNAGITEKLVRLTKTAKKFRRGNLDVVVDEGSGDEIGQLGATFNIMAARIRAFVHDLESKVLSRTKALQRSNEKLLREMDDRIKAQANQKETMAILQAALDNSQAGILIADAKTGNVRYINGQAYFILGESKKMSPDELNIFSLVKTFEQYDLDGNRVKPEDAPLVSAIRTGKPISRELLMKQPNNPDRFMWINASPIINDQGVVHAGISIFLDITKRKKVELDNINLELQLRQVHKMEAIGTLAGGIAHDFNNVLAAIIGYADLAIEDIPDKNPARLQIQEVLKAGNRAKDLVKQILAFSRKSQVGSLPVQTHLVLEEVVHLLRASIPSTIDIRIDIDPNCRPVLADQTQIHQVILNLCTNAAHAMEQEGGILDIVLGRLEIDADQLIKYPDLKPGPHVKLSVKDTGPGIEKQILDKIFDPYFTTKEVGKGSGMGLAMVHGIVKQHGGTIHVDSTKGLGSVFQVLLPEMDTEVEVFSKKDKPLMKGTEHILVVDDEQSLAYITQKRLERLGYRVTSKTSSQEALTLFKKNPGSFDLVITDQTMPDLTGDNMAKEMIRIQKDIPIILSTGYSSRINKIKTQELGIKAFLMKPVEMEELADCVRSVLGEQPENSR